MKHLIILAVGLMIVGLLFLVIRWPQSRSKTFSQHAAAHTASIYYYSVLFLIILPILAIFFFGYFIPTFHTSALFSVLVSIALLTQLIVVIVPETDGWKARVHRFVVTVSAAAILCVLIALVFTESISLFARGLSLLCAVISVVLMMSIIRYKTNHPYYLWVQIMFYTGFFGTVIAATYF